MSIDGQGTLWRRNIAENFNRLSRAHERYRQTDDRRRTMTYSEHELEFTFAKKLLTVLWKSISQRRVVLKMSTTGFDGSDEWLPQ